MQLTKYLSRNVLLTSSINVPIMLIVWVGAALISSIIKVSQGSMNNYYIFEGVYHHTVAQLHLYTAYPQEYFDVNHYGPFFSIIIAPFAVLPTSIGAVLWCTCNAAILYWAVQQLPVKLTGRICILLISLLEMITSIQNMQANTLVCSWLILSYALVLRKQDHWATLLIAAGFLMKLYSIVGLLFFVFSSRKLVFITSFIGWLLVCFALPMLLSSPAYIIQCYNNWYQVLVVKNNENFSSLMQNISVQGMVQRIGGITSSVNAYVLLPATIILLLPLLRLQQYKQPLYRLTYLCILLLTIVIYSTGAESATYIIATVGAAIAYVLYPKHTITTALLIFYIVLTSVSSTDLFPRAIRAQYLQPYSLKALPSVVVWLLLVVQLYSAKFASVPMRNYAPPT